MPRKLLVTLILILFLLPFVSWYYLNSGLQWRKKAQEIMNGTKPFPVTEYTNAGGKKFSSSLLLDHVSIVSFLPCKEDGDQMNVLQDIFDQFKETGKANCIVIDSCGSLQEKIPDELNTDWYTIPCHDTTYFCTALAAGWPPEKIFALVDRNGVIRSYYGIQTQDEKRILVEHMALLLPRERQEKVELKRGNKK